MFNFITYVLFILINQFSINRPTTSSHFSRLNEGPLWPVWCRSAPCHDDYKLP
jgi:hypothetical protein